MIFKALEDRRRPLKFFEMREQHGTFRLRKCRLDFGELSAFFPRRARDYLDDFADIDIEESRQDGSH